ncbi:PASTA domain-containing protein [Algoriphagus sp. AK58]|uniref:PASTA domain-containing protein n=1 Tax=Algoriphagus sp. AK58 TaxID=1406877 RepID=UPI0016508977|nr:PASTA domain-containing protein [Algoriphagus sp. AK58]MBC6365240.1 penicillin-binding protein [Algoriphagus sp. AK58]
MNPFSYSLKKVLINLAIIFGISVFLGFLFLKVYLPLYTNHGETVSVPDMAGYTFEEASDLLESSGLQYEVSPDSGFSTEQPALAILKQIPTANSQVKSGRKIYLTLNARNAPIIKMPNLENMPLKNAQEMLSNLGLERGDIIYVPDIGINVVLEQRYRGVTIREGFEVPKGSKIDLVVGDGMGNQILMVPSLIGMEEEDAEFLILGSGLRVGRKTFNATDSVAPGKVYLQSPPSGTEVRTGEMIDLWISKNQ